MMPPVASPYTRYQRALAVAYGVICHAAFAVAIASMVLGIFTGMAIGRGGLIGPWAWLANALLIAQFPVVHSFLLSERGRKVLARMAPAGLGNDLSTTTYATLASLQLAAVFLLWSPSAAVWWVASGWLWWTSSTAYALSWLLLLKTMSDAGMSIQTGSLGWMAVAQGRRPKFDGFQPRGSFRVVRQPVYIAFALTLWTAPVWTVDRLALALAWTAYCLLGPLLKERRYLRFYGTAFERYRRQVPYWLPRLRPTHQRSATEALPATESLDFHR